MAQQTHLIKFLTEVAGTAQLKDLQKTIAKLSKGQLTLGKNHQTYQKGVKGSITQEVALTKVQKQGSAIINARTGATRSMTAASRANAAAEKQTATASRGATTATSGNTSATNANTSATNTNTKAKKQNVNVTGSAGMAVTSLGQAFADSSQFAMGAAQGIRATTNNIQQVGTAMAHLALKTGGMTAGFKAMWAAMWGPLGLLFAFQGVTAAIDFFSTRAQMANSKTKELTGTFGDLLDVAKQYGKIRIGDEAGLDFLNEGLKKALEKSVLLTEEAKATRLEMHQQFLAVSSTPEQAKEFAAAMVDVQAEIVGATAETSSLKEDQKEVQTLLDAEIKKRERLAIATAAMGTEALAVLDIQHELVTLGTTLEETERDRVLLGSRAVRQARDVIFFKKAENGLIEDKVALARRLAQFDSGFFDRKAQVDLEDSLQGQRETLREIRIELLDSNKLLRQQESLTKRLIIGEQTRLALTKEFTDRGTSFPDALDTENRLLDLQLVRMRAKRELILQAQTVFKEIAGMDPAGIGTSSKEAAAAFAQIGKTSRLSFLPGQDEAGREAAASLGIDTLPYTQAADAAEAAAARSRAALENMQQGFSGTMRGFLSNNAEVIETTAGLLSQSIGGVGTAMMTIAKTGDEVNDRMFNTGKAFAIAEAIVNTSVGVTMAYRQGGFLGFAAAASIAMAGLAQVATIKATKPGSSGGVKTGSGGGSVGNFSNLVSGISNVSELSGIANPGTSLTAGSAAPAARTGTAVTIKNSGRDLVLTLRNELSAQRRMGVRNPLGIVNA
jgi:exonuclease VII small subunit